MSDAKPMPPPVYCDDECAETGPVCDFCKYFSWNIDALRASGDLRTCTLFNKETQPDSGCESFHCACYRGGTNG